MQDLSGGPPAADDGAEGEAPVATPVAATQSDEVVSTHVLISQADAEKLRELARRTRVAQSEYIREAVDDLLRKYGKAPAANET